MMLFSYMPIYPLKPGNAVNLLDKQTMIASGMAVSQFPFCLRGSSWHGTRITCTQNGEAARFLTTSSIGNMAKTGVVRALSPCMELLGSWDDDYDGVVVDPASLPSAATAFASQLQHSLAYWRSKGKKGIWLKLFENQADLVPIAIKEGFVFHDAEAGYVMLTHWIPGEPCSLPSGPSHQIGIAGFVINHNNEVLVVKEKCSCSCSGVWKLPTGFVNKFEDLFSAATREVKEETGIDTEFLELVAFRHVHRVAFEKSDLLFVCMLHPLSLQIQIDENEIQDAKWISVDELLGQQFYKEDEMLKRVMEICLATHEKNYSGFHAHQVVSKFDGKLSFLYYNDVR